jgi:long-chain acyl-CoA synthetase
MNKLWLSQYDEGIPGHLDYPDIPLDKFLQESADNFPERTATVFGSVVGSRLLDAKINYKGLNRAVNLFSSGLQQLGVKRGDRVTVMLPNSPQFIIAAYAIWRLGGILVCCNPLYVEREIEHLLKDSGSETMVVMSAYFERVQSIRANTDLKRMIVTNIKEYFPATLRFLFTLRKERKEGHKVNISGIEATYWFQDVLQNAPPKPKVTEVGGEDIATLIYTGGTTGVPKGVQLTHQNLVSNAMALSVWGHVQDGQDVMIAVMPYFHSYGMTGALNVAISRAMTIVLIPDPRNMVHVLGAIDKHKGTHYPGVPTMFVAFNNFPGRDKFNLSSLTNAISAAAPLPPEVQEEFERITGGHLSEAYGLTETSPGVTADPTDNPRPNSIGLPLPDTDVRIVDVETGEKELPIGEIGEIIVKGPQVMKGYWKMPTETANALRNGPDGMAGWFFTGDIGHMDEEGFFHISDRKKDMIIAGGYNIYPAEVEAVLYEHAQILEAAVIGVPDERRGETVRAYVVLKENQVATSDEIESFCRERLAPYKVPRQVVFRDNLPKSVVGKVLRRELREEQD